MATACCLSAETELLLYTAGHQVSYKRSWHETRTALIAQLGAIL